MSAAERYAEEEGGRFSPNWIKSAELRAKREANYGRFCVSAAEAITTIIFDPIDDLLEITPTGRSFINDGHRQDHSCRGRVPTRFGQGIRPIWTKFSICQTTYCPPAGGIAESYQVDLDTFHPEEKILGSSYVFRCTTAGVVTAMVQHSIDWEAVSPLRPPNMSREQAWRAGTIFEVQDLAERLRELRSNRAV